MLLKMRMPKGSIFCSCFYYIALLGGVFCGFVIDAMMGAVRVSNVLVMEELIYVENSTASDTMDKSELFEPKIQAPSAHPRGTRQDSFRTCTERILHVHGQTDSCVDLFRPILRMKSRRDFFLTKISLCLLDNNKTLTAPH